MRELKPCPYCGGKAIIKDGCAARSGFAVDIHCDGCTFSVYVASHSIGKALEKATAAWNRMVNYGKR